MVQIHNLQIITLFGLNGNTFSPALFPAHGIVRATAGKSAGFSMSERRGKKVDLDRKVCEKRTG